MTAEWTSAIIAGLTLLYATLASFITFGAMRAKVTELDKRVSDTEHKVDGMAATMNQIAKDVAVLTATVDGSQKLQQKSIDTIAHDVKNIEHVLRSATTFNLKVGAV